MRMIWRLAKWSIILTVLGAVHDRILEFLVSIGVPVYEVAAHMIATGQRVTEYDGRDATVAGVGAVLLGAAAFKAWRGHRRAVRGWRTTAKNWEAEAKRACSNAQHWHGCAVDIGTQFDEAKRKLKEKGPQAISTEDLFAEWQRLAKYGKLEAAKTIAGHLEKRGWRIVSERPAGMDAYLRPSRGDGVTATAGQLMDYFDPT